MYLMGKVEDKTGVNGRFRTWLQDELNRAGMSQSELAQRAGLSPSNISMVLSGDKGAGVDFIYKIASALRLRPGTVFEQYVLTHPAEPDDRARLEENISQIVAGLDDTHAELVRDFAEMLAARMVRLLPPGANSDPLAYRVWRRLSSLSPDDLRRAGFLLDNLAAHPVPPEPPELPGSVVRLGNPATDAGSEETNQT